MRFRILGLALLASGFSIATTIGEPEAQVSNQLAKGEIAMVEEAKSLALRRRELGAQLAVIFVNPRRSAEARLVAARALADLQYLPAIDDLIDYAHSIGPVDRYYPLEMSVADRYPMALVLAEFGDAAVPRIVEVLLNDRELTHLSVLCHALWLGESSDSALAYARGMEFSGENAWLKRKNLQLVEEMLDWLSRRNPAAAREE